MMKINYVTDAKAMKMMEEVVAEHAPEILTRLGFAIDDEILNKISVLAENEDETPHGVCNVRISHNIFKSGTEKYVEGSASINLYPATFFVYRKKNGRYAQLPFFARLFGKQIRRMFIHTLAHELRHYWQYDSGEYFRNESTFFGRSFMPYEWRWCEKDANQFAREYLVSKGILKIKDGKAANNRYRILIIIFQLITAVSVGTSIGTLVGWAVKYIIKHWDVIAKSLGL